MASSFHALSKKTSGNFGAEATALRMPGMPLAGGNSPGARMRAGNRYDRTVLSLGFLSWRKISHHALLAGLGKITCQERRLRVVCSL